MAKLSLVFPRLYDRTTISLLQYNSIGDVLYCHNESDVNYFLGLGCKDVRVMRSLMIPSVNPK